MFESKAGAYPSEAPFRGKLLAVPTNIGIGRKGLVETNTSLLQTFTNCGRKQVFNAGP